MGCVALEIRNFRNYVALEIVKKVYIQYTTIVFAIEFLILLNISKTYLKRLRTQNFRFLSSKTVTFYQIFQLLVSKKFAP